jgi:(4S)-4-hydroxy-5-phosphonooxypentane-2,3-dione isomerase
MRQIAMVAHVRVREGKSDEFLAAFASLLEQAEKEPGTLVYLVQRSKDDPHVFWSSEVYADEAAFEAHRGSEVHAATMPAFTELIAESDIVMGEVLMGKGLTG